MSQQIAITIDGNEGRVLPDSVGAVLNAVFALLDALDRRSWAVDAPRLKWRISEAKLVNPLTLTATGDEVAPEHGEPDVVTQLIDQLSQINRGHRPPRFTVKELKLAKVIGKEARRSRSLTLVGLRGGRSYVLQIDRQFAKRAQSLLARAKVKRSEYGTLEGTLVRVSNDPRRDDGSATLLERLLKVDVACHADPGTATRMAQYVNRQTRVIVYGTVTYEDDVAVRVDVEDFTALPGHLPMLDDLHALELRVPGGAIVEDYLDDLRGDA
jgi:hypothetical protein